MRRLLEAALLLVALVSLVASDSFRTVRVGEDTDWGSVLGGHGSSRSSRPAFTYGWSASSGDDADCDDCQSGHHQEQHVHGQRGSLQPRAQRRTHSFSENELLSGGRQGRGGSRRGETRRGTTTYRYSSKESTYSFSNGTHKTTITSKEFSDAPAEFHLKMIRLRDNFVLEDSVLSEAEYAARRASLGLTGSAGSFGFESLGGDGSSRSFGDSSERAESRSSFEQNHRSFNRGLDSSRGSTRSGSRRGFGDDFFGSLGNRFGSFGGGSRNRGGSSTTTTFSSEESYYSFSNGTHTTAIRGKKNSAGVQEYHLELIRNSDDEILDRVTISEEEYERRRRNMSGGRGFADVFDQPRTGSRQTSTDSSSTSSTTINSRGGFSSSTDRDSIAEERQSSERCTCVEFSRCSLSGMVGYSFSQCPSAQVCCRPSSILPRRERPSTPPSRRPSLPAPQPSRPPRPRPHGSSHSTTYRREEEETRVEENVLETEEDCICTSRIRCRFSDRVRTPAALRKCSSAQVCCRGSEEEEEPERPVFVPQEPIPETESCSCVSRNECSFRDRIYNVETRKRCGYTKVCCKSPAQPQPTRRPQPTAPPRSYQPRKPAITQEIIDHDRELFGDILDHVGPSSTNQQVSSENVHHARTSSYDEAAPILHSTEHRQSYSSRTESTRSGHRGRGTGQYGHDRTEAAREVLSAARNHHQGSSRRQEEHDGSRFAQRTSHSERQHSGGLAAGRRDESHSTHETEQHLYEPVDLPGAVFRISTSRNSTRTATGGPNNDDRSDLSSEIHRGQHSSQFGAQRFGHSGDSRLHSSGTHSIPSSGRTVSSSRRTSYTQSTSSSGEGAIDGDLHQDAGLSSNLGLASRRDYGSSHSSSSHRGGSGSGREFSLQSLEPAGGQTVSSSRRYSSRRSYTSSHDGTGSDVSGGSLTGSAHDSGLLSASSHDSGLMASNHGLDQVSDHSGGGSSISSSYRSSWSSRSSSSPEMAVDDYGSSDSHYSQRRLRKKRGLFSSAADYVDPRGNEPCSCVPFYRCSDGNVATHGADLLNIRIGFRKQCKGFNVCCALPPGAQRYLESTPGYRPGAMMSIPTSSLSPYYPAAPVAAARPCICVANTLCDPVTREIQSSQIHLVDMRQISTTGRCNYGGQVCCAVPSASIIPTPASPVCQCTFGTFCSPQDIMSPQANPAAYACAASQQVCCTRPLPGAGTYTPGVPIPGVAGTVPGAVPGAGGFLPGPPGVGFGSGIPGGLPGARNNDYDVYQFCKAYPLSVACGKSHPFARLPTIRPSVYFNAKADAQKLKSAIGSWWFKYNADDEVLIEVLTKRTFAERRQIMNAFASMYGEDLVEVITKATRGKFENLMQELLEAGSYYEYLARKLHEGMDRLGTDEDVVLETLISSTNEDIRNIGVHFYNIERKTLLNDVEDDLTGDLEDIMVALINGTRDSSLHVDAYKARQQAQALYRAGKGGVGLGTEEKTFFYYLTHENYAQLALIFAEYEQLTGETFEEALEDEFSRHTEEAVLAIVSVTRNLPRYFAERVHDALWGRGPLSKDDSSLRRILISRAEIDLGSIAQEYQMKYGRTLIDDVETKTTGDYEDGLVSLLGGQS